jgi:hypothetical protein
MKLGIFILIHHKPWLINSSLLTLFLQKINFEYDLNFVLIKGDGKQKQNIYYKEYFKIANKVNEYNQQLSDFDSDTLKIIKKVKRKYFIHEFENDQGLDSGAWLKLLKSKKYIKYDYCLFLMEGFLFTSENVLMSIYNFVNKESPDFVSSAHEKRFLPKKIVLNKTSNLEIENELEIFKKKKLYQIIKKFSKNTNFSKIINKWPDNINYNSSPVKSFTENHVSKYNFSTFNFFKLFLKKIYFSKKISFLKKTDILVSEKKKYFFNINSIYPNNLNFNNIIFHEDSNPYSYGCSCQHLFSRKILLKMDNFFIKNKLYHVIKYPFFGEIFEIFWGLFPKLFNLKKWYFNGIHRVRKNFLNDKREDSIDGMLSYLNFYYKNKIFFCKKNKKNITYKVIDNSFTFIKKSF